MLLLLWRPQVHPSTHENQHHPRTCGVQQAVARAGIGHQRSQVGVWRHSQSNKSLHAVVWRWVGQHSGTGRAWVGPCVAFSSTRE